MKRLVLPAVTLALLLALAGPATAQTRVSVAVRVATPHVSGVVVIGAPAYHRRPAVVVVRPGRPHYHRARVVVVKHGRAHRQRHSRVVYHDVGVCGGHYSGCR